MTKHSTYTPSPSTRGYFGIGVEGISKPMNLGNLFRSAHAFGASFGFTINAHYSLKSAKSDTSLTPDNIPFYQHDHPNQLVLAAGCELVGVELVDMAIDLPSFRHPRCAAYVLGPERGQLSEQLVEKCSKIVRIPTRFCINVATAGAIVMYDRLTSSGRFGDRPVTANGGAAISRVHVYGAPLRRRPHRDNP